MRPGLLFPARDAMHHSAPFFLVKGAWIMLQAQVIADQIRRMAHEGNKPQVRAWIDVAHAAGLTAIVLLCLRFGT